VTSSRLLWVKTLRHSSLTEDGCVDLIKGKTNAGE
jgi:hypothetical protein